MGDSARPRTVSTIRPSKILTAVRPSTSLKEWDDRQSQVVLQGKPTGSYHPRSCNEAPCSNHEAFDWVAIGLQDGVDLDERGAYIRRAPDEQPLSRLKQVEQGFLPCPVVFYLMFETFPIWVLALDSIMLSNVCFMGVASQAALLESIRQQGALVQVAIANVGENKVTYSISPHVPTEAVLLVSGSLQCVKNWNRTGSNPTLIMCDEHVRNKHTKYGGTLRWTRLRHDTFGGVTHYQAVLGTNIPGFEPVKTTL
jgi:hypothetical protein